MEGLGDWLEKLSRALGEPNTGPSKMKQFRSPGLSQYALAAREWCSGMGWGTLKRHETSRDRRHCFARLEGRPLWKRSRKTGRSSAMRRRLSIRERAALVKRSRNKGLNWCE